jgi:hypothetical protein
MSWLNPVPAGSTCIPIFPFSIWEYVTCPIKLLIFIKIKRSMPPYFRPLVTWEIGCAFITRNLMTTILRTQNGEIDFNVISHKSDKVIHDPTPLSLSLRGFGSHTLSFSLHKMYLSWNLVPEGEFFIWSNTMYYIVAVPSSSSKGKHINSVLCHLMTLRLE